MLKKVMRGIKATIHGGTKYERSVKKSLKNDDVPPKEKHLIRIVNGLNDQDDETSLIKAEELMQQKFVEAKDQSLILQKLKLLLVIDVVADNKYLWKAKDEEKLTNWIKEHFLDQQDVNFDSSSNESMQNINTFLLKYSIYVKHKIALLHNLNPYHQNQLSQNTTPLEEFFNCVHQMNEFEDLIVENFLNKDITDIAKTNDLIKCIVVNIFATECSLFTSTLVLIALFSERCFSSNQFMLQQLIEVINIFIKKSKRFISVLKNIEFLGQFQLLIFKLKTSLLSKEFLQIFQKFSQNSTNSSFEDLEELRKSLSKCLTKTTIDFFQLVQNIEKKSAFGKIFQQQYQDLLNEEDPHRAFKKDKDNQLDHDPFELYQNVYSISK
ncbi:hypothetical protein ABPG72_012536 [Tetrahymena utriculariae]